MKRLSIGLTAVLIGLVLSIELLQIHIKSNQQLGIKDKQETNQEINILLTDNTEIHYLKEIGTSTINIKRSNTTYNFNTLEELQIFMNNYRMIYNTRR